MLLIVGPVIILLVEVGAWGVQRARARDSVRRSGNGDVVAGRRGVATMASVRSFFLIEVLSYLPLWAVVSKSGSRLVEGWTEFSV